MGETIISVGRTGLFLRLGAAPAGLVILLIRYTQGSAALHPGLTYFAPSELKLIADDLRNRPLRLRAPAFALRATARQAEHERIYQGSSHRFQAPGPQDSRPKPQISSPVHVGWGQGVGKAIHQRLSRLVAKVTRVGI